jgi:heat-inducible transcriptional repressor
MDALMQSASKAVSMITNVAGIVITPRFKRSVFKKVEFIPIDTQRILTVLVTGSGLVKNTMLEFEEEFTVSELERMAEFLNEELEGMFLGDIRQYLTRRVLEERDSFYSMLEKAIDILSSPGILKAEERLYFDGATSIMSCPEFRDISKARLFLRLLEEKSDILDILNQDMDIEGIKVHIGRENPQKSIQEYTIVTSNYKINDTVIGAVGAIGPTRVEYGKVISAVDYIAGLLGEALEHLG